MALAEESRPEHCFDWLSANDVATMAVHALTLCRRSCYPPAGELFSRDGALWASRGYLADLVGIAFALQVKAHAYRLGIVGNCGDDFEKDAAMWAKWESPPPPARGRLEVAP